MACIEHDEYGLLSGSAGGSHPPLWHPGDLQHGPGAQFTSEVFTGVLMEADIRISMNDKGQWVDNVFVERLWRSHKYEEVCLKAYETVAEARQGIANYFRLYNGERRYQRHNQETPYQIYRGWVMWQVAT